MTTYKYFTGVLSFLLLSCALPPLYPRHSPTRTPLLSPPPPRQTRNRAHRLRTPRPRVVRNPPHRPRSTRLPSREPVSMPGSNLSQSPDERPQVISTKDGFLIKSRQRNRRPGVMIDRTTNLTLYGRSRPEGVSFTIPDGAGKRLKPNTMCFVPYDHRRRPLFEDAQGGSGFYPVTWEKFRYKRHREEIVRKAKEAKQSVEMATAWRDEARKWLTAHPNLYRNGQCYGDTTPRKPRPLLACEPGEQEVYANFACGAATFGCSAISNLVPDGAALPTGFACSLVTTKVVEREKITFIKVLQSLASSMLQQATADALKEGKELTTAVLFTFTLLIGQQEWKQCITSVRRRCVEDYQAWQSSSPRGQCIKVVNSLRAGVRLREQSQARLKQLQQQIESLPPKEEGDFSGVAISPTC